jgi:hypothetical protein
LHTGVGLVKLPRRLRNQLTQKIAVTHRVECVINQVRAHDYIFSLRNKFSNSKLIRQLRNEFKFLGPDGTHKLSCRFPTGKIHLLLWELPETLVRLLDANPGT